VATACAGGPGLETELPDTLWGGGGARVLVHSEMTHPATLGASFSQRTWSESLQDWRYLRSLGTVERLAAGSHDHAIDVPAEVGGRFELCLEDAHRGRGRVHLAVDIGSRRVWSGSGDDCVAVDLDDLATGSLTAD
jgi:hypothetical protein